MRTQTFTGITSREVLDKVKAALGDDALILSNRSCEGGIEIVALSADELPPTTSAPAANPPASSALASEYVPPAAAAAQYAAVADELIATMNAHAAAAPSAGVAHFQRLERPAAPAAAPAATAHVAMAQPAAPKTAGADMDGILTEIQSLRNVLRSEIAAFAAVETKAPANHIGRPSIMRELLNAGFSAQLARRLTCDRGDQSASQPQASSMQEVASRLQDAIRIADADEIINQGGVYALVGPTGVGKTTTVAKLAARAVVRFGASKVALLTTDSYRIGAHDQLKIYGRILSVPVHAIRDADDLAATLEQLAGKHLVLIDTIGMSQRDRMVAEQAAMLAGTKVKRILLVATTANAATLNQVVSIYKGSGVEGCILTKTDEAASLTPAIDAVVRHELPVHYVTDGQRVPEDLQLPDVASLAREALNPPSDPAFEIGADELPHLTHPTPAGNPAPAAPALPATAAPAGPAAFVPASPAVSAPASPAVYIPQPASPAVPVLPVMHAMAVSEPQARVVHG